MSAAAAGKPPIPDVFDPFPRIPVDESGDFHSLLRIATFAANVWCTGADGPYANPEMTGADRTREELREGLMHLLELGLIDIDAARLAAIGEAGFPPGREARW